ILEISLAVLNSEFLRTDIVGGEVETEEWARFALMLPHALTLVAHTEEFLVSASPNSRDSEKLAGLAARLMSQMGSYLIARGDFRGACDVLRRALMLSAKATGV